MAVKVFVGNLTFGTNPYQLRELFEQHGVVVGCDVLGGYGFVHMDNEENAKIAIKNLSGSILNGSRLNIQLSTSSTQGRTKAAARGTSVIKIFVGNLAKSTTKEILREVFETYGMVSEADVLGGFGFVHMVNEQEAFKAIKSLNGYSLDGSRLNVELSTGTTQGKSRDREISSGHGPSYTSRSRAGSSRYEPYVQPSPSSRRSIDAYDPYGRPSSDLSEGFAFARDLLELYIKNPLGFDAYVNNPKVRMSMNLPPVEDDEFYSRLSDPASPRSYDYHRLANVPLPSLSPPLIATASGYSTAAHGALASVTGRAWPGSSYPGVDMRPQPSGSSARGRGHLYTPFE